MIAEATEAVIAADGAGAVDVRAAVVVVDAVVAVAARAVADVPVVAAVGTNFQSLFHFAGCDANRSLLFCRKLTRH
jgi:hypothetical protein